MRDRAGATDHLNPENRILVNFAGWSEFWQDLRPISIQLIGEHHRQRSLHSLTKLEAVNRDQNFSVRLHVHKGIWWIDLWRRPLRPFSQRGKIQIQRHQQATGGDS